MLSHLKRRFGVFAALAVLAALTPALSTSVASAAPATTATAAGDTTTLSACPTNASIAAAGGSRRGEWGFLAVGGSRRAILAGGEYGGEQGGDAFPVRLAIPAGQRGQRRGGADQTVAAGDADLAGTVVEGEQDQPWPTWVAIRLMSTPRLAAAAS